MSVLISTRLRGKARDWNWHNVIGFWSSAVLIVLTLTAAVMSYPWANDLLVHDDRAANRRRARPKVPPAPLLKERGRAANAAKLAPPPLRQASMFY